MLAQDNPAHELQVYVERNRIRRADLVNVLKWFTETQGGGERGQYWSSRAVSVIGRLRLEECIPYLEERARQPERTTKVAAVNSITQIGGTGAMAFAARAISDTNSFSASDRLYLYDRIMRHAITGIPEGDVVQEPSSAERQMGLEFLIAEPRCDEKLTWVLHSEENMAKLMPMYRTNDSRLAFLAFFCANAPEQYRPLFVQRLDEVRRGRGTTASPFIDTNTTVAALPPAIPVPSPVLASAPAISPTPASMDKPHYSYAMLLIVAVVVVLIGYLVIIRLR